MIWNTIWDVSSNLFGFVAIVGPFFLVGWYLKAAKEKIRRLHEE